MIDIFATRLCMQNKLVSAGGPIRDRLLGRSEKKEFHSVPTIKG